MKSGVARVNEERILAEWAGSNAAVWMYHVTHRSMLIRLDVPGSRQALFIVAGGCERINGALKWSNATISIERLGESVIVSDRDALFNLQCSFVSLYVGSSSSFDSFDGQ